MKPFSHPSSCLAGATSHLPALQWEEAAPQRTPALLPAWIQCCQGLVMLLNGNNFNVLGEVPKERSISGLAGPLHLLCSTSYQVWEPGGHGDVMGCCTAWQFLLGCSSVQILHGQKIGQDPKPTKVLSCAWLCLCSLVLPAISWSLVCWKALGFY